MHKQEKMELWQPPTQEVVPASAKTAPTIAPLAQQLSKREQRQIVESFERGHYEMVVNFVWQKTMAALKRELGTLGVRFLGEMLDRTDLTDDDDVIDSITEREALRLAEELGVVSATEAMRLRQTHELVAHFARMEAGQIDSEAVEMDEAEAIRALKACVRNVLGKPKIEVATRFADFRSALESETLSASDDRVSMLLASPYFFQRLTISVLLSVVKAESGAKLENSLANLNTLLPRLWQNLRDAERWQVGHTYVEVYAAGKSTATRGVKEALLKVRGFDYVPENLRSDAFVRAAEDVIKAHEGFNNFYNEESPMRTLLRLGSTIPPPAFSICASAILAVTLGNVYGASYAAAPLARRMLDRFSQDRWQYYLDQCLPGDIRIFDKLSDEKPRKKWIDLVDRYLLGDLDLKNKNVAPLIAASKRNDEKKIEQASFRLREQYYGKPKGPK